MTNGETHTWHDLALFEGGPFVHCLRLAQLRRGEIREIWRRRALCLMAVTWLPLLLLSWLQGNAFGEGITVPFVLDAGAHVRFLIVVPLLVVAELGVHERVRGTLRQFVVRDLVKPQDLPRFREAIASAIRLRNSWLAEVVMLLIVFALAIAEYRGGYSSANDLPAAVSSWHALPAARGGGLSLAGYWFMFVSLPLFQFLTLRWYYRIFIWARLLWPMSRLDLNLTPTHPDRLGGLGFLSQTIFAYLPLALAHGAMLSAVLANRILHGGASLTDFSVEIAVMVGFVFCLVLIPLLFFGPVLLAASLRGLQEYGVFAEGVVRTFDQRWLREGGREQGALLDVAEVSAMTDLDTTLAIIQEMHFVPISRDGVIWIAGAVSAPMLPLLLTLMPADELLRTLVGMLL